MNKFIQSEPPVSALQSFHENATDALYGVK